MTISQYFPIYDQLDKADQERLDYAAVKRRVPKGTLLHGGDGVCTGLLVIASGQLRAHMICIGETVQSKYPSSPKR